MKFILLLAVFPAITIQQCLTPDDTAASLNPGARLALYVGEQQFALNMLMEVNRLQPTENVFFSPFSVYNALLLAYFAASNHTEASLKSILNLPPSQDKLNTMQAYRLEKYLQSMREYNGSANYEFSSANRLYISPKQTLRECMQLLFKDEVSVTDFAKNPKLAVQNINKWVAEQTRNQIKDLLPEDSISGDTQLVLANAAYFKGVWKTKFQPESTRKDIFFISNSQNSLVTMMKQKSTFNHLVSEKLGAHVLELPYKGEHVSMYILLPPFVSPNGLTNILKRLSLENFKDIVSEEMMVPRPVDVSIPKFSIEHELHLTPILETMGVGDLFQASSDLSGLTGQPGLSLDSAIHKAKITLNEEGTTAAAATALFNFRSSRPLDPMRFNCNHPFVYLIFDKGSQSILFMGIFNKPPQKV